MKQIRANWQQFPDVFKRDAFFMHGALANVKAKFPLID
jgi:hypothetical protein